MGAELYCDINYNEPHRLLTNTVCLFKGEPVYVRKADTQHRVQISYLKDLFITETVDYRDKDFRYNSPPLGYMNYKGEALYLSRIGGTGQSAALTQETLVVSPEDSYDILNQNVHPEGRWMLSKEMGLCIKGEHPSLPDALKKLRDGEAQSMAFHRHYALRFMNRSTIEIEKRGNDQIGVIKNNKLLILASHVPSNLNRILTSLEDMDVSTL